MLKLDVQGWELEVLKGASSMLANRKIRFIFAEVGFDPKDQDMVQFGPLSDALSQLGFQFSGFYDVFRYGPQKRNVGFANALFTLPE